MKHLAADPETTYLVYPAVVNIRQGDKAWQKHLYVDANAEYHFDFNNPESNVLQEETANKKVQGWLRNTDRKSWALCVPYDVRRQRR